METVGGEPSGDVEEVACDDDSGVSSFFGSAQRLEEVVENGQVFLLAVAFVANMEVGDV